MLQALKERISRQWGKTSLKVLNGLLPEAEPDSWSDLKREELEYRVKVGHAIKPAAPSPVPLPVYRNGGQIHNFAAATSHPSKRLTRAQYDARYQGYRPVPPHLEKK